MVAAIDVARLSGPARNALFRLEKRGTLMRTEDGKFYGSHLSHAQTDAKVIEALAAQGLCRVETVGKSTFAHRVEVGK